MATTTIRIGVNFQTEIGKFRYFIYYLYFSCFYIFCYFIISIIHYKMVYNNF